MGCSSWARFPAIHCGLETLKAQADRAPGKRAIREGRRIIRLVLEAPGIVGLTAFCYPSVVWEGVWVLETIYCKDLDWGVPFGIPSHISTSEWRDVRNRDEGSCICECTLLNPKCSSTGHLDSEGVSGRFVASENHRC